MLYILKLQYHIRLLSILTITLLVSTNVNSQFVLDSLYNQTTLEQALDSAKKYRNYKDLADIYYLMGEYEDQINVDRKKAFDNFTWSLVYYKMTNDSAQIKKINYKIAIKYAQASMYDEAIELLTNIKESYIKKNQFAPAIKALLDIAQIYHEQSELEKEMSIIKEAKALNESLENNRLKILITIQEIAPLMEYKDYDAALQKAFYAFKLADKAEITHLKGIATSKIGKINLLNKDYKNAAKYVEASLELINITAYDKYRLSCYKDLSDSYSKLDDYKKAYIFQKKYTSLNDSILNLDRVAAINKAAIKYESREKKHAIKTLEKENIEVQDAVETQKNWVIILVSGLILLMLIGYYVIRHYTHRIKTNKIITSQNEKINKQKIRELEDKIELSSMQSLIEGQEKERHRVAKDLHDSLGGLLSTIKLQFNYFINKNISPEIDISPKDTNDANKVNELLDLAVNEIRSISHDLQPESLSKLGLIPAVKDLVYRFSLETNPHIDFQYYNIPENLDKKTSLNIYRILQELLNNAIKHSQAKEILIQLDNESDGDILIQFEDDGIGYDYDNIEGTGMGLENIKSRIAYLKGEVEVDSSPGKGTSVLIRVKTKLEKDENTNKKTSANTKSITETKK